MLLLVFHPSRLSAQPSSLRQAVLSVTSDQTLVRAALRLDDPKAREVLASMREGLKAEILFQLRLYRRQKGLFSFLGDRLIVEKRLSQVSYFDIFEGRYVIQGQGREPAAYGDADEFLRAFCTLPEYELAQLPGGDPAEYYVLARIRLTPVKMVPPLNIITLLFPETAFSTPWLRERI